eukprot:364072-Chlamydomonas_euryale.AAC.21
MVRQQQTPAQSGRAVDAAGDNSHDLLSNHFKMAAEPHRIPIVHKRRLPGGQKQAVIRQAPGHLFAFCTDDFGPLSVPVTSATNSL